VPDSLRILLLPAWVLFGIAWVEEGSKRMLLLARGRRDRHIDEPFDWIVYAVAVALGFATVENLVYVLERGAGVGLLRAFTAVPSLTALRIWAATPREPRQAAGLRRQRCRIGSLPIISTAIPSRRAVTAYRRAAPGSSRGDTADLGLQSWDLHHANTGSVFTICQVVRYGLRSGWPH
jgi:hypothetical protein